jgi:hypothetical protein
MPPLQHQATDVIAQKLHRLRQSYHRNQALRGAIVLLLLLCSAWFLFSVLEGLAWLPVALRTTLVVCLVAVAAYVAVRWVTLPLLQYAGLVKGISNEQLAQLVGDHFPQVQDKLLNLLQLKSVSGADSALMLAAIQRKAQSMATLPFTVVVDYLKTLKLLRWLLPPLLLFGLLWVTVPEWITGASYRMAHFDEPFFPPPPFTINVQNHPDVLPAGESANIAITVGGKERPGELFLYLRSGNEPYQRYALKAVRADQYSYTFTAPTRNFEYAIGNDSYRTQPYVTNVVQRPAVQSFYVVVQPPAYTRLPAQTLASEVSDFSAPVGSRVQWHVQFKEPVAHSRLQTGPEGNIKMELQNEGETGLAESYLMRDTRYRFALKAKMGYENNDSIFYTAKAVPDRAPSITMLLAESQVLVPQNGNISLKFNCLDDYGFSKVALQYRFTQSDRVDVNTDSVRMLKFELPTGAGTEFMWQQALNVGRLFMLPGDVAECAVVVWDNDAIAGPKATTGSTFQLVFATKETAFNKLEETQNDATGTLNELVQKSKAIDREIERLRKELMDRRSMSAEDRAQLQNLETRQKELAEKMNDARKQLDKSLETARQNQLLSKDVEKNLQDIKELTKPPQLQDPEMQEFFKQMRDRSNLLDKKLMNHQLQKLQQNNEALRQNAERIQELFKQWKADQKLEKVLEQTRNLQARQDMLQQNTERAKNKQGFDNLKQKQNELRQDKANLQRDLQQLQELKQQTRRPDKESLDSLQQRLEKLDAAMQQAESELANERKKQAAEKQKQIKEELQQMGDRLAQMRQDDEREQQAENYEDLRNLLENLLKLSFDQEALRNSVQTIRSNDPSVERKRQEQNRLKDEMRLVEDSLTALSKRVVQIQEQVMEEVRRVNASMDNSVELLTSRNLSRATSEQHMAMTSLNTLANMLTDALRSMQQSMKQRKGRQGGKTKPNPMQIGMPLLLPMQEGLNQNLEQMMQEGEKGAEKLEQAARQQEEIRRRLQELYGNLKEEGKGGLTPLQKAMEDMQKTEEDLRKGELTQELIQRQQQILNRMLDYDKALRERELEERRESQTGQDQVAPNQTPYKTDEEKERLLRDQLNRRRLQYNGFYQRLSDDYFDLLLRQQTPKTNSPAAKP